MKNKVLVHQQKLRVSFNHLAVAPVTINLFNTFRPHDLHARLYFTLTYTSDRFTWAGRGLLLLMHWLFEPKDKWVMSFYVWISSCNLYCNLLSFPGMVVEGPPNTLPLKFSSLRGTTRSTSTKRTCTAWHSLAGSYCPTCAVKTTSLTTDMTWVLTSGVEMTSRAVVMTSRGFVMTSRNWHWLFSSLVIS